MDALRIFELLDDLPPSGSAKAVLLRWDGEQYVNSRDVVDVHDVVSCHGDRGDRGYAFKSQDSNHWEVLSGLFQQVPRLGGL